MPRTILQIDDELAISAALTVRLRAAGYALLNAPDGRSGLAAAAEHRPDAILLDIRMPGMDGFEVCRRLKASPDLAGIPVIFLSANAGDDARRRAGEIGAAGFLAKPYEPRDVLDAIEQALAGNGEASEPGQAGDRA